MDFVDKNFKANWEAAKKSGIRVGAYHFFTFRSKGKDQAQNFINTVPNEDSSLPPVIDIEFGGNSKVVPDREVFNRELDIFIDKVREAYGQEPILYVLYDSYDKYIKGGYRNHKIWIRDIIKTPRLKDKDWIIWQHSNRGRLKGINTFVDLNVFNGSKEDFERFN